MRTDLQIASERIRLRALEPEDLSVLFEVENGKDACNFTMATGPYSRYQLKRYLSEMSNDLFKDGQLRLVVELKAEKKLVGFVDLFDFVPRYGRAELGVIILSSYRRKGMAAEALGLLEAYCRDLGLHQLYAYVYPSNNACIRLLESNGYLITATLQQWFKVGQCYYDIHLLQKIIE